MWIFLAQIQINSLLTTATTTRSAALGRLPLGSLLRPVIATLP